MFSYTAKTQPETLNATIDHFLLLRGHKDSVPQPETQRELESALVVSASPLPCRSLPRCWLLPSAGKAHDIMALKCRGCHGPLNFPLGTYGKLLPYLDGISQARISLPLK